jgi:hypothetical protein
LEPVQIGAHWQKVAIKNPSASSGVLGIRFLSSRLSGTIRTTQARLSLPGHPKRHRRPEVDGYLRKTPAQGPARATLVRRLPTVRRKRRGIDPNEIEPIVKTALSSSATSLFLRWEKAEETIRSASEKPLDLDSWHKKCFVANPDEGVLESSLESRHGEGSDFLRIYSEFDSENGLEMRRPKAPVAYPLQRRG